MSTRRISAIVPGFPGRLGGLAALLGAAVIARLAYGQLPSAAGDGGAYLVTAARLLSGDYFFYQGLDVFVPLLRTPVYPLFLAAAEKLSFGSWPAAIAAQHLLGAATAALVYGIALRLWRRRAVALCSGLFAALHFHFLYAEAYPVSEPVALFLFCAACWLALAAREKSEVDVWPFIALGGLAAAGAALCRTELLPPVSALCLLAAGCGPGRRWMAAGAWLLPLLLFCGLWTARNRLLYDFSGLSPNSGVAFFCGPAGALVRPEDAAGEAAVYQAALRRHSDGLVHDAVYLLAARGIPYQWSSVAMGRAAVSAALKRPGAYLAAAAAQLPGFLFPAPHWPPADMTETMPDIYTAGALPLPARLAAAAARADAWAEYLLLTPLFLAGCFLLARAGCSAALLLAGVFPVYLLAVYAFCSPAIPRYRVLAEPFMGLAAAYALFRLAKAAGFTGAEDSPRPAVSGPAWRGAAAAALCCALAGAVWFSAGLLAAGRQRTARLASAAAAGCRAKAGALSQACRLNLGFVALESGLLPAAQGYFEDALAAAPYDAAAASGLASALFQMGRSRQASAILSEAFPAGAAAPSDIVYNRAVVDLLSGGEKRALPELRRLLADRSLPPELHRSISGLLAGATEKAGVQ